ncbi:conserved hypothetical protein [Beggiatoa sp. SS]|nr:conserved hypothetical protein [Beggiatoa sp. SS]
MRGRNGKWPYQQQLRVRLPQNESAHEAMATVWARQKVRELMNQKVRARQTKALIEAITQIGLTYRLMTQWTSFVAVEEKVVNVGGKLETVVQEVEMPEGVAYDGVFGEAPTPAPVAKGFRSRGGFMTKGPQASSSYAPRMGSSHNQAFAPPPIISKPPYQASPSSSHDIPTLGSNKTRSLMSGQNTVTFEPGKASLSEQAKRVLELLAIEICQKSFQIKRIVITGHTDNSQLDDFKNKLSRERALAVADYLMKHCAAKECAHLIFSTSCALPEIRAHYGIGQNRTRRLMSKKLWVM